MAVTLTRQDEEFLARATIAARDHANQTTAADDPKKFYKAHKERQGRRWEM